MTPKQNHCQHLDTYIFDASSPLSQELQAAPWLPGYRLTMLPSYDGQSNPKQFLLSYEAIVASFGANTSVLANLLVMALQGIAQTWYSSLKPGSGCSW